MKLRLVIYLGELNQLRISAIPNKALDSFFFQTWETVLCRSNIQYRKIVRLMSLKGFLFLSMGRQVFSVYHMGFDIPSTAEIQGWWCLGV